MKLHFSLLCFATFLLMLGFQSCDQVSTSDSDNNSGENTSADVSAEETTNATVVKHSEMTPQQHSDFVAKHADHIADINKTMAEIKHENHPKHDQFEFACGGDTISLQRVYNDAGKVHILTYSICKDGNNNCSTKNHFIMDDKLIYQLFHHEVRDGTNNKVDDHKTYFKDGKMLKCLEKVYSYQNGESIPEADYALGDCIADDKLTKNMDKLISMSEEELKTFICSN